MSLKLITVERSRTVSGKCSSGGFTMDGRLPSKFSVRQCTRLETVVWWLKLINILVRNGIVLGYGSQYHAEFR